MPNGQLVRIEPNLLDVIDRELGQRAFALGGNVSPVGRNVAVTLIFRRNDGVQQANLGTAHTNDQGAYTGLHIPSGLSIGAPDGRFLVSVGNQGDGTLTRAFVCNDTAQVNTNIDFRSEAVVRVILNKLAITPSCELSDFSPQEICDILARVYAMDGSVEGDTAAEINAAATAVVANDSQVQRLLDESCGIFIPPTTRSATATPQTPTPTIPQTVLSTATRTLTVAPTTAVPTNTPGVPTNTALPTSTATPTQTGLAVIVSTSFVNGQGVAVVDVSLAAGGSQVGGVQNDILFDNRIVNLAAANSCRINPAIGTSQPGCDMDPVVGPCKTLSRQLNVCGGSPQPPGCPEGAGPEISRFRGIIAATAVPNANTIPGGVLYTCDFTLQDAELLPAVLDNNNVVVSDPLGTRIEGASIVDGLVTAGSTATGDVLAGATEIELADSDNFPQSGTVRIGEQIVGFTLAGDNLVLDEALEENLSASTIILLVPDEAPADTPTPTPSEVATTVVSPSLTPTTPANTPITPSVTPTTPVGITPSITPTAIGPTVTPTTPSATATQTFTQTVTATPTATLGPLRIDVGMANGARGATVEIPVTIQNGGNLVVATANDITYDRTQVRVLRNGDVPDCTIAPDIAMGTSANKMLVMGIETDGDTERLRVGVVSFSSPQVPIRDGLLFTCRFEIDEAAEAGQMLANVPSASDANGNEIAAIGSDGAIGLAGTLPLVVVESVSGAAGATVNVPVRLVTGGQMISAVGVDIVYDSARTNVVITDGDPACTIDASIGEGTSADKMLISEVVPLAGTQRLLRLGVISFEAPTTAIPTGPLFSCQFAIAGGATGAITLDASAMVADMAGVDSAADAADGTIQVQ